MTAKSEACTRTRIRILATRYRLPRNPRSTHHRSPLLHHRHIILRRHFVTNSAADTAVSISNGVFVLIFSRIRTLLSLFTFNPFAKLRYDDFSGDTLSWTSGLVGSLDSYSFPSSNSQAKLRVPKAACPCRVDIMFGALGCVKVMWRVLGIRAAPFDQTKLDALLSVQLQLFYSVPTFKWLSYQLLRSVMQPQKGKPKDKKVEEAKPKAKMEEAKPKDKKVEEAKPKEKEESKPK
ncbi:hypothetical protein RND71_037164 [Anisodus tanguticus]|uniref:Uncharacterized protein n=1 Tax=Anisodus tanguticus TaxID=243964 RepID=A0AAE1R2J8_9SOLA|nr:hypothetical protein RND71_037164 [Anisodus tanguticus]